MKMNIDISVFAEPSLAAGMISGTIELPTVPRVGEFITFSFPDNDVSPMVIKNFPINFRVEDVLYNPNPKAQQIVLALQDITLSSPEEADIVFKYMEEGFGFYADKFAV